MAYGSTNYSQAYGTPQSQGPQGQAGASGQPKPQAQYNPQRAPMWKPAPSSQASQPRQYQAQQQAPQTAAPGSPVTPNGQIAPAQQPQQQQPQRVQAPPLTTPPQGQDPFQGQGVWTGEGWVDRNHPMAQPFLTQQTQPQALPQPAPFSPYGPYPGRPQGTTYQPGQLPDYSFQTYDPLSPANAPDAYQFQQYQMQDFGGQEAAQQAALARLMGGSMSPQVVEQLKARQRESAMSMGQQAQDRAAQDAASRGVNLDGQLADTQANLQAATQDQLLGAYRDIDIGAASQNFQDQLAALGMSNDLLNSQASRGLNQYGAVLQGQGLQAGENAAAFGREMDARNFAADENRFAYQSQYDPAQFGLQRALSQEQLNQGGVGSNLDAYKTDLSAYFDYLNNQNQGRQLDITQQLGQGGLDVDRQRLAQQGSQFDRTHQLNWAQFLNDMSMGRYGLGLDYAKLQQAGQQGMFDWMGRALNY